MAGEPEETEPIQPAPSNLSTPLQETPEHRFQPQSAGVHSAERAESLSVLDSLAHQGIAHRLTKHLQELWHQVLPVAILENKASVARDHLANERTFLAWLRTSLGLTSAGVAIAQLFLLVSPVTNFPDERSTSPLSRQVNLSNLTNDQLLQFLFTTVQHQQAFINHMSQVGQDNRHRTRKLGRPIGICFVLLGLSFLSMGTYRYFKVQSLLQLGQFPHSRGSIGISTISVIGLVTATMCCILNLNST